MKTQQIELELIRYQNLDTNLCTNTIAKTSECDVTSTTIKKHSHVPVPSLHHLKQGGGE